MKNVLLFLWLLLPVWLFGQFHSWDGITHGMSPKNKIRCLNIFVNVIYDIHPEYNNSFDNHAYWPPVTNPNLEGINNQKGVIANGW